MCAQGQEFTHFYFSMFGDYEQLWKDNSYKKNEKQITYTKKQVPFRIDDHRVATFCHFVAFGLEEWISGSKTWLTSFRCIMDNGTITDPKFIDCYSKFFNDGTLDQ